MDAVTKEFGRALVVPVAEKVESFRGNVEVSLQKYFLFDSAIEPFENFLTIINIMFYVVPIIHMIGTVTKLEIRVFLLFLILGRNSVFLEPVVYESGDSILQIGPVFLFLFFLRFIFLCGQEKTEVDLGSDV